MKTPLHSEAKYSLPGMFKVVQHVPGGPLAVHPLEDASVAHLEDALQVVYDHGPVDGVWQPFHAVRARLGRTWTQLPKHWDPLSPSLRRKMDSLRPQVDTPHTPSAV